MDDFATSVDESGLKLKGSEGHVRFLALIMPELRSQLHGKNPETCYCPRVGFVEGIG